MFVGWSRNDGRWPTTMQVTEDHFAKAVRNPVRQAVQQQPAATGSYAQVVTGGTREVPELQGINASLRESASSCGVSQTSQVGDGGLEPSTSRV